MRTLSATGRVLTAAAVVVAAALVLGGAYFVGYVSELQRALSDPASIRSQAAEQIAQLESALGYDGFLKIYRNYRLTGEASARPQLSERSSAAARAVEALQAIYADSPVAADALREVRAVADTFAHIATTAPDLGPAALRGTAAMENLNSLPQTPQLETAYLSLRTALDRLAQAEQDHQLGGVASALNWTQMLIVGALACLVLGLVLVAGLLQLGIIHPLKSLERSLTAVGDGAIAQKVWGTDRGDEIGELARAGEKLRRGLTETTALKAMAEKGQLSITLDNQSSVLFEKLAAEVTSAATALKSASADLAKLHDDNRQQLDAVVAKLGHSSASVDEAAKTLRCDAAAAIDSVRTSSQKLVGAATESTGRIDQSASRFEDAAGRMDQAIADVSEHASNALSELSASTSALARVADRAQSTQGGLATACQQIETDAAITTEKVRTLAGGLSSALSAVDERLSKKLGALDQLERNLTGAFQTLRSGADETIATLSGAASTLRERNTLDGARLDKTIGEFESAINVLREGDAARQRASEQGVDEIRAAGQSFADAAKASGAENRQLAEAMQSLHVTVERLSAVQPAAPVSSPLASEFQSLSETLRREIEGVRGEIRDMAVRMTEDRILSSAGAPSFATNGLLAPEQAFALRTLADVPGVEIMTRLKDLAAEMNATQSRIDSATSLKAALGAFADEIKTLAPNADRAARFKIMGKALDHHADEIEAHAGAIEASAEALRTELHAITGELRTIAARSQTGGVGKDGPVLREAALELGARAQSLFTYLDETHRFAPDSDEDTDQQTESIDAASADIAALAELIGRLEARAEQLSRSAVASRFDEIGDTLSPTEREADMRNAELKTDGAIHTVFESIERLNNIAAALARAGDAERQRKVAH